MVKKDTLADRLRFCASLYPYKQMGVGMLGNPFVRFEVVPFYKGGQISMKKVTRENYEQTVTQKVNEAIKALGADRLIPFFTCEAIAQPYQLEILSLCTDLITPDDYAACLSHAWQMTEFPHQLRVSHLTRLLDGLPEQVKMDVMDDEERVFLESLQRQNKLTVYRGIQSLGKTVTVRGLSWTLDFEKAEWFSTRWQDDKKHPLVYSAEIPSSHIYAYFEREKEVVVKPRHLKNLQKVVG